MLFQKVANTLIDGIVLEIAETIHDYSAIDLSRALLTLICILKKIKYHKEESLKGMRHFFNWNECYS